MVASADSGCVIPRVQMKHGRSGGDVAKRNVLHPPYCSSRLTSPRLVAVSVAGIEYVQGMTACQASESNLKSQFVMRGFAAENLLESFCRQGLIAMEQFRRNTFQAMKPRQRSGYPQPPESISPGNPSR